MPDEEIYVLASDYESWSIECGVDVRNFDSLGFARAIEQASRRAALEHCADVITNVIAHGGDMNAALGLIRALADSDSDGGKS